MTGIKLMLKDVRLAMTQDLFVPAAFKNTGGAPKKYRCKLLIRKDHPQILEVKNEIMRLAKEEWKDRAAAIIESIKGNKQNMAFLDGDLSLYEGFPGNYSISATRREKDGAPTFVRANPGTKDSPNIAGPNELYSGSFVNASISFWTWSKDGYSMNCNLLGLQEYRKGEAFAGGGTASAPVSEFANEETVAAASGDVSAFL